MSTVMQFGNSVLQNNENQGFELVESGYLSGTGVDTTAIDLSSHQMYILFTREIIVSNGSVRGFRAVLIARTENDGTVQRGNLYASTNTGATITATDEVLTIKPSSTAYDVYYALYAVM